MKTQTGLTKQLKEITKSLEQATSQQSKLAALRKHLNQFEKEWASNKKTVKATKPKATKQHKPKIEKPQYEETRAEPFEESISEDIRLDETTELTP